MSKVREIIRRALKNGRTRLSEYESKLALAEYGVPIVREMRGRNLEEVRTAASHIGYPVVLKVCGAEVIHKTEKGLLELDLRDEQDLSRAFQRLQEKGGGSVGEFLVQEMAKGSRELVAGMIRDPQFGPCVMLGLGGIFTESLGDVTFRVAPLKERDIVEMFGELKGSKMLGSVRGLEAVSMETLCRTLQALGNMGLEHPQIQEIDVNPLIVRGSQPVAVDALMVLAEPIIGPSEKGFRPEQLETFFSPRSVVVIGASSAAGKPGNDVIRNILDNGYRGALYLVNPKGGEILGTRVHSSIEDLPEGIDLAVVILPAKMNPQAIRSCAAKGIKAVVLAAGGFAEVNDKGKKLQVELEKAIKETGVRVIGPNTSGHTSTPHHFTSSFFPQGRIPRGNISYIAQTGNFATHTMRYIATGEKFGVARVLGLGNKVDVEESEALQYLADDPETKAIFMYLESFQNPRRFLKVADHVTRSKPVVLLKGGRTPEGVKAAVAHTAALASDQRITEAALKQVGIVQVYRYSHLFTAAKALSFTALPKSNRVGVIGPSGAMLVVLSDFCVQQGLSVPKLEDSTREYLQKISPPFLRMRNPVDIWGAATMHGIEFGYYEGMKSLLKDSNIDAVVAILMLTERTGVPSFEFLVDLAKRFPEKPTLITFTGEIKLFERARRFLEPQGIPTYPLIEEPVDVLGIMVRCRRAMER